MSLVFLVTVLFITISTSNGQQQRNDNCDINVMDQCAQKLFGYGDRSYHFATTREATLQQCKSSKEAESCIRQYNNRCVKPFARQYINIMLRGPSKSLKETCNSKKGIEEYLRNTPCLTTTKRDMDDCTNEVIENFMIVPRAKKPDWIPLSCCYLSKLENCSRKAIDNKCPADQTEYTSKAMKNLRGDVLDLFCDHELEWGSSKCENMINKLPSKDIKTRRPASVLPVILNLMNRYVSKS